MYPLCTLTHSLKHFWTSVFEFREVQTFIIDPLYFLHTPPPPWIVANLCWKEMQCSRSCTPLTMALETMTQHVELFVLFALLVFGSHYHVHSWHQVRWWCPATWQAGRSWACIVSGPSCGTMLLRMWDSRMEGVPWCEWVSACCVPQTSNMGHGTHEITPGYW